MDTDLQIQNKKLELIQWLSTIEDLNFLEKILSSFLVKTKKIGQIKFRTLKDNLLKKELHKQMLEN